MNGQVFWITGLSGAGKTSIGTRLYYRLKKQYSQIVLLDGDIIKRLFGIDNVDYSKEGRRKRAFQYSELCKLLASQGITVICCAIAMFDEVRAWNRKHISNYYEIFIDVDLSTVAKRDAKGFYKRFRSGKDAMVGITEDVEFPKNPDIVIKNDMDGDLNKYIDQILLVTMENHQASDNYWDKYYESAKAPKPHSDFAEFAMQYMEKNKKVIELGCGNGRDSIFFCDCGLKVTAVDSSKMAIASIDKSKAIFSVCDDFVTAKALFCVDYDYCYARWSIHSITLDQQTELFHNIYGALKEGGLLFIEARTINDAKYGLGEKLGTDEYFYDNHYRRFMRPDLLIEQLKNIGFEISCSMESDRFSILGTDSPTLIRLVAKKLLS